MALHVTGAEGAGLIKSLGAAADDVVVAASKKGAHGRAWLGVGGYRALRPHPIVGAFKGVWKGNAAKLAARAAAALDPGAWWIVPLLASWVFVECGLLIRRWGTGRVAAGVVAEQHRAVRGRAA
jgi:hypothetical protein